MIWKIVALGVVENYTTGWVLHYVYLPGRAETHHALGAVGTHSTVGTHSAVGTHSGPGHGGPAHGAGAGAHGSHEAAAQELSPLLHFLRDSTLALPVTIAILLIVTLAVRAIAVRVGADAGTARVRIAFACAAAIAAAMASVPEVLAHGRLFDEQIAGVSMASHLTGVALVTLRYTFALTLIAAVLFGVPWRAPRSTVRPLGLPIHGEA
ncbi:hypothetical protein GCM10009789_53550 [Kribbella sancticallisti]|uniref:Uncharacterized protein n=1 Tax=Kribbella sancticallisti TaxID=460087 RepID=A0ABN2E3F6_9ACTN